MSGWLIVCIGWIVFFAVVAWWQIAENERMKRELNEMRLETMRWHALANNLIGELISQKNRNGGKNE